ncbi:MAG TPA: NifB/NifX family molybdenum-iron cluster-binding protein [Negativicutes bacterium]|nr:NifB/NifX family molybdenum-iron cluster-binding protein [Negativicutes bacterium]
MAFKVAVASSDGKFINQHFGRAEDFYIFVLNETGRGSFRFLEQRSSTSPCSYQQHDDALLEATAVLLADCKVVLVNRIGTGARMVLASKNIIALEASEFIGDALIKVGRSAHILTITA